MCADCVGIYCGPSRSPAPAAGEKTGHRLITFQTYGGGGRVAAVTVIAQGAYVSADVPLTARRLEGMA